MNDLISREAAIKAVQKHAGVDGFFDLPQEYVTDAIRALPSVQPEPLSDDYMKAVLTWLINYQIKAAELKGRYTPYEVLSWLVNDWRKEHE